MFTLFDNFTGVFFSMITACIECLIIGWFYGVESFSDDLEFMIGKRPGVFFKICWTIITPAIMIILFLTSAATYTVPTYDNYVFPPYATGIGFILAIIPILPIFGGMAMVLYKENGTLYQRLLKSLKPTKDWGPSKRHHKAMYDEHLSQRKEKPMWLVSVVTGLRRT